MRRRTRGLCWAVMLIVTETAVDLLPHAVAQEYSLIPGLSAQDRVVLATNMVQQGQYKNGLVELTEAMKELPNDEALMRLKGQCETELLLPDAKVTIMKWLKLAPQSHPERAKMLALLAKTQASMETPNDWVLVPAAEFEMGDEGGPAQPDETPKHRVHVDSFYIGKYEVTNRQYHTFVKSTGHRPPENEDPKYSIWRKDTMLDGIGELPVINVSWDDAVAFCKWAGGRLPTEAEWEKAARGTDGRRYPWGNDPVTGNRSNFSIENITFWDGPATLARKDQYDYGRSPYGAYEMAGNVWEWVQDFYDENYYKNSPSKNPTGP
ncbi:MAG TPA: SUMF1/EgtB/PvdO family nonheme iron enzyme, partial [Nitrospiraceae bacterium]|nr:SUMF1/EgtB/PvdO family nonheme iron enzyme [Nitrospiraceae bacterium]